MILPAKAAASDFSHVVIAWKDRREARRAVADALPFIKIAKRVSILHVEENEGEDRSTADVKGFLDRHGVACEVETLDRQGGPAEGQIVEHAGRLGADLIVAGAYGHSRLREWALGGVTRRLLTDGPVACLLSH
jgi:nucleotide-binding universal stress UspA family protein